MGQSESGIEFASQAEIIVQCKHVECRYQFIILAFCSKAMIGKINNEVITGQQHYFSLNRVTSGVLEHKWGASLKQHYY
ncbi:MAG: hypothetical protein GKR90_28125 [Pseudomonadales bacterium]|nr:hypothetical protein [Pseudomonadales bacterium]